MGLQLKTGSANDNDAYTGEDGEVTVDLTYNVLRLHDGVTPGGIVVGEPGDGSGIAVDGTDLSQGKVIRFLRGSTTALEAYDGEEGELTVDTTLNVLRLFDGADPVSTGWIVGEIEKPAHPIIRYTPVFESPENDGDEIDIDTPITMQAYEPALGGFYETQWVIAVDANFTEDSIVYNQNHQAPNLLSLDLANTPGLSLIEQLDYHVKVIFKAKNEDDYSFSSIPATRSFTLNSEPPSEIDYEPIIIKPAYSGVAVSDTAILSVQAYDGDVSNHYSTEWVFATSDDFNASSIIRSFLKITPNHTTLDLGSEFNDEFNEGLNYYLRVKFKLLNDEGTVVTDTATTTRRFQISSGSANHDIEDYTPIFTSPQADGESLQSDSVVTLETYNAPEGEHYTTRWELSTNAQFTPASLVFDRYSAGNRLVEMPLNNGWASYVEGQNYWLRVTFKANNDAGNRSYDSKSAVRQFGIEQGQSTNPVVTYTPVFVSPYINGDVVDASGFIEVEPYSLSMGQHIITRWMVSTDDTFSPSSLVFDRYGSSDELLKFNLLNGWGTFEGDREYWVRASFQIQADDGGTTETTRSTTLRFKTTTISDESIDYTPTITSPASNAQTLGDDGAITVEPYDYSDGTHLSTVWEVYYREINNPNKFLLFKRTEDGAYRYSFNLNNGWGDFQEGVRYWVRVYFKAESNDGNRLLISKTAERSFIFTNTDVDLSRYQPVFIIPDYDGEYLAEDTALELAEYTPSAPLGELTVVWRTSTSSLFQQDDDDVEDIVRNGLSTIQLMRSGGIPPDGLFKLNNDWGSFVNQQKNWARVIFKSTNTMDGNQYGSLPAKRSFVLQSDARRDIENHTPQFSQPAQSGQTLSVESIIKTVPYSGGAHYQTRWEVSLGESVNTNLLIVDQTLSGSGLTELKILDQATEPLSASTTYSVRVTYIAQSADGSVYYESNPATTRFKLDPEAIQTDGDEDYIPIILIPENDGDVIEETESISINQYNPGVGYSVLNTYMRILKNDTQIANLSFDGSKTTIPLSDLVDEGVVAGETYEIQVQFYAKNLQTDETYDTQSASRTFSVEEVIVDPKIAEDYTPVFTRPSEPGRNFSSDETFVLETYPHSDFEHFKTHYDVAIDSEFAIIIHSRDELIDDGESITELDVSAIPSYLLRVFNTYHIKATYYFRSFIPDDETIVVSKSGVTSFIYLTEATGTSIDIPNDYPALTWPVLSGTYAVSTDTLDVAIDTTGLDGYDDLPPGYSFVSTSWTITPIASETDLSSIDASFTEVVEPPAAVHQLRLSDIDYEWDYNGQYYSASVALHLYNSNDGSFYTRTTTNVCVFTLVEH